MIPSPPIFSDEDRAELRGLHCNERQIESLEQLLPTIRALTTPAATLTEVREHLMQVQKNFKQIIDIYNKNSQYGVEIRARLQEACLVNYNDPSAFDTSLRLLNELAAQTLKALPSEQRRNRKADPKFVQLIYQTILENNDTVINPINNLTFPTLNQHLNWRKDRLLCNKKIKIKSNFDSIVSFCLSKSHGNFYIYNSKRAIRTFYQTLRHKSESNI